MKNIRDGSGRRKFSLIGEGNYDTANIGRGGGKEI